MNRTYTLLAIVVIAFGAIIFVNQKDNNRTSSEYLRPASALQDVHGLAVDVADPAKLWIASHNGLYVLKDDKNLFKAGSSNDDYMGFAQDPTRSDTFYTAGHNAAMTGNKGFQRTEDGGRTWKQIGKGASGQADDFHALAVSSVDRNLIYGSAMGRLQKSTDGGASWQYIDNAPQVTALATSPDKKNTIFASTQSGLQVSTDQGNNWKPTGLTEPVRAVTINPANASEIVAYSQNGLVKTIDGGLSWQPMNGNPLSVITYIAYDTSNPSTMYTIGESLEVAKTTNGGETWQKVK